MNTTDYCDSHYCRNVMTENNHSAGETSGAREVGLGRPLAPDCLQDLPQHRREMLLWRNVLRLGYDGVEEDVLSRAQQPCPWRHHRKGNVDELNAVLADDARYHLCRGEEIVCGEAIHPHQPSPSGLIEHEQWCYWWTDGTHYRVQPPQGHPDPFAGTETLTVRWAFSLLSTTTAPELIPPTQRCPTAKARGGWPAYHNPKTVLGRLRAKLAEHLGNTCHACQLAPANVVDHDHRTGLVRGMLCRYCNAWLEDCPHLSGCPWADYLNSPPAAPLQLTYPQRRAKITHSQRRRAEILGFTAFK